MRVLVTGAAGDIGSVLVPELLRRDHVVDVLVREEETPPEGTRRVTRGDAGDPDVASRACADVDGVLHLAAIPAPIRPPDEVFRSNTAATHAVLEAAGRAGVRRAVLASSVSLLGLAFGRPGRRPAYLPVDEDHPVLAEDPYALSKQVDEITAAAMHRRWGMAVVPVRLPFVGRGERLAERVQQGHEDPGSLVGDLWGYLRTEDAAAVLVRALELSPPGAAPVVVAADDTVCDKPTAELVAAYLPEVPVRRPLPARSTVHDLTRARRVLGWRAARTWRDP